MTPFLLIVHRKYIWNQQLTSFPVTPFSEIVNGMQCVAEVYCHDPVLSQPRL